MQVTRNQVTSGEQGSFVTEGTEVQTSAKAQYVWGKLAEALDQVGEFENAKQARMFANNAKAKPGRLETQNGSWATQNDPQG